MKTRMTTGFFPLTLIIAIFITLTAGGCGYYSPRPHAAVSNVSATGGALDSSNTGEASKERIVTFNVTGKGLVPETAINIGQGRLMAERAAINDGYRKLVEKIRGVYIDAFSQTTNGIVDYDVIRTKTQSWLRGVEVISVKEEGHGIFSADMQLRIYFTQNDMIWWPAGLGSNVIPAFSNSKQYYLARPSLSNIFNCVSYPWCGNYFYYRAQR